MANFDLTPLFRSSIGFDHMMSLVENLTQNDKHPYPPYNIEKIDDNYIIRMAVAGFSEEQLTVALQDNTLIVSGKSAEVDDDIEYLHKGIAQRGFERHFQLADFIEIGGASLENGLLAIHLLRKVPEASKMRKIDIMSKDRKNKISNSKILDHD